jgi:hypothetical protein
MHPPTDTRSANQPAPTGTRAAGTPTVAAN